MKLLVDTNIVLDVFLSREKNTNASVEIFELIYQEKVDAFITASTITDIYYIVEKRLGNARAREVLQNLINILNIITVEGEDCAQALDIPVSDYEDALIIVCSNKIGIDFIITNDNDFLQVDSELAQIIRPREFLRIWHSL